MEKKRLGRGLDSLLGGDSALADAPDAEASIDRIQHNPYQPRKNFDADELASLCASVKVHGILQPIVVRQVGDDYQLIAGERRLRAATDAGLTSIPIHIVDFNDQQVLEAALVENIQRTDLNPIEKAQGFKEYIDRFGMQHEHLAQKLGLARSTITNLVSLLDLPTELQEGIRVNQISEAHAKVLKGVKSRDKQIALFKQIVAMGLSVKATDSLAREQKEDVLGPLDSTLEEKETQPKPEPEVKTSHVKGIEDELRKKLSMPIEIKLHGKDKGQILLRFDSNDDFERILEILRR